MSLLMLFEAVCIRLQGVFITWHDYSQPLLICCSISSPTMTHSASIVIPLYYFSTVWQVSFTRHNSIPHLKALTNTIQLALFLYTIPNHFKNPLHPCFSKGKSLLTISSFWKKSVKTKVWKQRNVSVDLIRARLLRLEHFQARSVLEWPFSSTSCSRTHVIP